MVCKTNTFLCRMLHNVVCNFIFNFRYIHNDLSFSKSELKVTMGCKCNFLICMLLVCNFAASFINQNNNMNMKQIEKIAVAKNFNAINVGKLSELGQYVLELGSEVKIPGKVFGGQVLKTTGAEFSFQSFAPGTETGFLHTHKTHEELYFFLAGKGDFQVDGQEFPVSEGSVVRVSPEGLRSVRNNGSEPLVMLCVQYKGATFTADDAMDGIIADTKVEW